MPWPTLTRRMQFYIDQKIFFELGEALPVHKDNPAIVGNYPLQLTGGHTRWSIHSIWRDNDMMLGLQQGEPTMWVSAEDARLMIDIAFKYNDNIERLILRPLNPPNYVAIGTSAWDLQSEILVSQEDLQRLRDPKLTTKEFQTLYAELTHEVENVKKGAKFY